MNQSRVVDSHLKRVIVSKPKTGVNVSETQMCQNGSWSTSQVPKSTHYLCLMPPVPVLRNGIVSGLQSFASTCKSSFVGNSI